MWYHSPVNFLGRTKGRSRKNLYLCCLPVEWGHLFISSRLLLGFSHWFLGMNYITDIPKLFLPSRLHKPFHHNKSLSVSEVSYGIEVGLIHCVLQWSLWQQRKALWL